jgi:hypothetical protein
MLANAKHMYALDMWTVAKRPNGWFFSKSAYHGDKHEWRGPYASEASVTLMIARELLKEIKRRHKGCNNTAQRNLHFVKWA